MASFHISTLFLLHLTFHLLSSPPPTAARRHEREALQIIIGGGHHRSPPDCPPPPPPPPPSPCPPPASPFENARLEKSFNVIQRFKQKITGGDLAVLETWTGFNVCVYRGFRCDRLLDTKENAVSGVNFNGFKFSGGELVLNGFMDELDDIAFFHANSNFFVGGVPANVSRQRFFYEMDLSNNRLSGSFPAEVFGAKQLTFLDLRFNNFCGPIPAQLFNQDIITAIFINNNRFTSCLPPNLGNTPARYLTFAGNQFNGPIPSSIGQAKKTMEEIVFRDNLLDGCLPYEIGFLEKATLFDVGNNRLTGPIPMSFACLAAMELLYLADNRFYGPVPEVVCKLPKLGNFTLRNNFFTEIGAACRKLIKKKVLDVSKNCISDLPNQKSKAECAEFFSKPRYCGNDESLKHLNCRSKWYLHPSVSNPADEVVTVAPKKAYAALSPDGR